MDRERWSIWTRCSHNHSDREPDSASTTPRSSTPLTAPVSLSPQRTIYSSTVVLCQLCFCNEKGQFGVTLQRKSKERDFVRIDGTQCLYFTSNSPQKKLLLIQQNNCIIHPAGTCDNSPLRQSCQRGGYQDPRDCSRCRCPDGWTGTYCERLADSKTGTSANCGINEINSKGIRPICDPSSDNYKKSLSYYRYIIPLFL